MKFIFSKSVDPKWMKRRKKDKAKLKKYWSNIYPDDYAMKMVAKTQSNNQKDG